MGLQGVQSEGVGGEDAEDGGGFFAVEVGGELD